MEREIKFRIYLKGVLWGYEELREDGWYSMCLQLNPDNGERWNKMVFRDGDFVRKQFTGLHDKSEKEIYEGDVDHMGWVVCFEDGVFCIKQRVNSKTFIPIHEANIKEIIGNIYSNPELLK